MEELQVILKNGQPYGIRYKGGYLLFFTTVTKYSGQEERYVKEIQEAFTLSKKIIEALKQ